MAMPRVRHRIPSATYRCMPSGAVLLGDQSQEILWGVRRCGLFGMGSGRGALFKPPPRNHNNSFVPGPIYSSQ